MKLFRFAPVALMTVGMLAACSSLVGDIDIGTNVVPIGGQEIGVAFPAPASLKPQVEGTVTASKTVKSQPFDDIDASKVPFTIQKVVQAVGIESVTLTPATCAPPTVKVVINELSGELTDASTKKMSGKVSGSFTATKGATSYTVSDVVLSTLTLTGDSGVLTSGGANTLTVKLDLSATSDPSLAGCTLTVKLKGGATKVGL